MKILNRLKKSINTILRFIRAFELAYLLINRTKEEKPQPKKKECTYSVMGLSRTVLGREVAIDKRKKTNEDEIDYEAESIPLETVEVSFESLEKLNEVSVGKPMDDDSKETLKKLQETELGAQIKSRISSLLDQIDFSEEGVSSPEVKLTDLSSYLE